MQLFNTFVVLAASVVSVIAQGSQLFINTPPSVVKCQPAQLTFGGGTGPYFIAILPGGQVTAPAIEQLGQQAGPTFTWKVDQQASTSLTFKITDSSGQIAYSGMISVQDSSDNSCVGKGGAPSGGSPPPSGSASPPASSAAGGSSAPAGASPSSAAATSPAAASPTSGGSSSAGSAPAASASSSPKPNAANTLFPGFAGGIVGGLIAAVIA